MMYNLKLVFLGMFFFSPLQFISAQASLSMEFHKARRDELRSKMPGNSVAVFFSAPIRNRANDVNFEYHQDPNFYYLTGWKEPHAVLLVYSFTQKDYMGTFKEKLYVQGRDARDELWNGKRKGVEGAAKMGFDRVASKDKFISSDKDFSQFDSVLIFEFKNDVRDLKKDPSDLFDLQKKFKTEINYPENFDRLRYQIYQEIRSVSSENIQNLKLKIRKHSRQDPSLTDDLLIKDFLNSPQSGNYDEFRQRSAFLMKDFNFDVEQLERYMAELREIKMPEEIALLKKAIQISAQAQVEVMKAIHPRMTEREVQGIHQLVFKKYGAAHEGYPSIVGAGDNACVLHYIANSKTDIENQLILMDLGAEYESYTADITRTIPVSGKFTEPQRQLYQIVYEAQSVGIEKAVVGASFADINRTCYEVVKRGLLRLGLIEKPEDFSRYLPHGVSHHIGLDVHDPGLYAELEENMLITIEPGIYVPENSPCDSKWWNIGIRIEDDILITKNGPVILSDSAPREWKVIENMIERKSALDDFTLPELED